jgi:hypothetical protein
MYQHPGLLEMVEEERQREKYPDPRELRMYERRLGQLEKGPGRFVRLLVWLRTTSKRAGGWTRQALRSSARVSTQALREECEIC